MRSPSILLRLLVGLGLIFNGPGYGSAASIMHVPNPALADAATFGAPDVDDASPCPEHADPTSDRESPAAETSAAHDRTKHEHDTSGCCGSAACAGSCVAHAPASFAQWVSSAFPVHGDAVRPMSIAHASPALPPRIRPPIA